MAVHFDNYSKSLISRNP